MGNGCQVRATAASLGPYFEALAPSDEGMKVGELDSVPLADGGDQPTVDFGYGTVRLKYASSAVRRMASLAYVLTWAVSQHVAAAEDRGMDTTHNMIVLLDEIEAHLHPRWQRSIVRGLRTAIPLVCDAAAKKGAGYSTSCGSLRDS